MKKINDETYLRIVEPILGNKEFASMKDIKHHDSNRLDHCKKVSYYSYKVSKLFNLNAEATARAGLLHDFYFESILEQDNSADKFKLYYKHQEEALINSRKHFDITDREENIIITHMFPLTKRVPRYKESWIVSTIDKSVSIWEFTKKANYKFGIYVLFVMNIIKVSLQ